MRHIAMNRNRGLLQIHTAALLAGFTGLFGKYLSVSPFIITGGRTMVAGIAVGLAARYLGISLRLKQNRDLLGLALSGAILAGHWITFFWSIQVSTVAVGLLGFASYPLFVTLLEPILFRESWHTRDLITALAVVVGLILVVPSFNLSDHITRGLLWGIFSGFLCAAVSLLTRSFVGGYPPMTITFYQQAFAAVLLLPALFHVETAYSGKTVGLLVLLGVLFTAILQLLYIGSLRYIKAHTASVVFGLEPVYGILFAALFLGEIPSLRTILGGALICGAVFFATLKHAAPPPA